MPDFTLTARFPAPPRRVYDAWLDADTHGAMTGAGASTDGARFTAWDGYIEGEYLEREPGRRITMSWRTADFGHDEPHAHVEIALSPDGDGTRLTLTQSDTPPSQGDRYVSGWEDFYFTPMQVYFGRG